MADETTNVVKTVSDGTVKITVERYQELLAKAAEKIPVNYTVVQKTKEMVANDNKLWGGVFIGFGVSLTIIGGIMHTIGRGQARKLR